MSDNINHPKHYTSYPSGIEAIELCQYLGFCLGNAVKYIIRADHKNNRLEDWRKAEWYLKRGIDEYVPYRAYKKAPWVPFMDAEPSLSVQRVIDGIFSARPGGIADALEVVSDEIRKMEAAGDATR